ncbi:MAG: hypothetical protein ACYC64_11450 [Armatimonadota bacterium]
MDKNSKSERNWVLMWAAVIVLLSSVPYIWGALIVPGGYHFLGLTHNIDDGAVYLSWMRQAADGHFFLRNLFTNDPQAAQAFNVLFLVMGNFAHVTHMSLIWVFHLFRIGLGMLLIWTIWRFSKLFLNDPNERRLLIPLVGLSAGIGWLIPGAQAPKGPVDVWQPEAITFLSIYLNPLFLAALVLMIWSFYFLVRMQRAGRVGDAIYAGLLLLVLGNVHTYDIITVGCVWAAYVVVDCVIKLRIQAKTLTLSLLAAVIALPSVAYQYHIYQIDPVFRARANSPTPSPEIWSFFAGYGLVLVGAIIAVVMLMTSGQLKIQNSKFKIFLVVWGIVGFIMPYIPIGQQRKLVMGLHVPLCILCAYALCRLTARVPVKPRRGVFLAVMLFMVGSNVRFVAQDMKLLSVGRTVTHFAPFMSDSEICSMRWLRDHTCRTDTVFAPPTFALFTPAFIGHRVYYGHWSETPNYAGKIALWGRLYENSFSAEEWLDIVAEESKSVYYVSESRATDPPPALLPSHIEPCYANGRVRVFRISRKQAP